MRGKKMLLLAGLTGQSLVIAALGFFLYQNHLQSESPKGSQSVVCKNETLIKAKGIVVPSSGYIKISPSEDGVIQDLFVQVGQNVKEGELLFELQDAGLKSLLEEKEAEYHTALAKLRRRDREVTDLDIQIKEKEVAQLEAECAHQSKVSIANSMLGSAEDMPIFLATRANLEKVRAEYQLLKAKLDTPEREVELAEVEEKLAHCRSIQKRISDVRVKSPVDGKVLMVTAQTGERVNKDPIVWIGSEDSLMLKVLVDADKSQLIEQQPKAIAVHKKDKTLQFPLHYVETSPCLKSDNGSFEEGKGKYVELFFSFDNQSKSLYLEQLLDVYIHTD